MADEAAEELGYGGESAEGDSEFAGVSEELANERLETKHKTFFIDLKRNERGLFVKISERSGGRRSTVMIPYEHIDDFSAKLAAIRAQGPDPKTVETDQTDQAA
jgi:hypothetical protein